jgi:hypothetical protein
LLQRLSRRPIIQEVRRQALQDRSPAIALRLLVSVRFQVLFHLPSRHSFHLSLTVLVHYRSLEMFSLTRWSWQIQTGFHVPRPTWEHLQETNSFRLRAYHPLWWTFPDPSATTSLAHSCRESATSPRNVPLHPCRNAGRLTRQGFRLLPFRSPLLRQSLLLSSRPVTEMFHFAGFPRMHLSSLRYFGAP